MTKQDQFEIACDLASTYHEGQSYFDEGSYYNDHLIPVSISATRFAQPWLHPLNVQTVGVLHDILEYTECTADILPGFVVLAISFIKNSY